MTETDPREQRLPVWAHDMLRTLREQVARANADRRLAMEENDRLRQQLAGKAAERGDSDTFLVNEDTGDELPLGKGALVRFGIFDVRVGRDGQRWTLNVQGENDLVLRPVQSYLVKLTEDGNND